MAQTLDFLAHHHDCVGYLHDLHGAGKFLSLIDLSRLNHTTIASQSLGTDVHSTMHLGPIA